MFRASYLAAMMALAIVPLQALELEISSQDGEVVVLPFLAPGTVWKAELGTSGDWFDDALWTEGVPDATTPAFLVNGSETRLTGDFAAAQSLIMKAHTRNRVDMARKSPGCYSA